MKRSIAALTLLAALAAPLSAQAHRGWLLPSSTTLSGSEGWVGVDAGASNGVFIADHAALRLDNLVITAPDGSTVAPENVTQSRYRSTFDVHLTVPGTYKIANVTTGMSASYKLNGEEKRWRGPAAEFATAIPAGAAEVRASNNANRIETFVTLGEPTETVFVPARQGLELVPVSHPNDLVVGEAATFTLLMDGKPVAGQAITVARGGTRYRDNPEELTVTTGADGRFEITWPEPGMYWINAVQRTEPQGDAPGASLQYTGVVEVLS